MTEKALVIKGPLADLRDVLRIAVAEGQKILKSRDVHVQPLVFPYGNESYVVVVKSGCLGVSGCGKQDKKEKE